MNSRHLLAAAIAAACALTVSPGPVAAETSDARSARKPAKPAGDPGAGGILGDATAPAASPVGVKAGQQDRKPIPQVDPTKR